MLRIVCSILIAASCAGNALAQEIPDFLKDRVYTTDTSKCGDSTQDDSLQLSREGIFGYEFGCTFLGFDMEVDKDTGKTYLAVVKANCGDDTGINRPDLITLIPQDEHTVMVQSQNEFIIAEAQIHLQQRLPQGTQLADEFPNFVSREYKHCK